MGKKCILSRADVFIKQNNRNKTNRIFGIKIKCFGYIMRGILLAICARKVLHITALNLVIKCFIISIQ